jgi:hypothetical protein
MRGLSLAQCLNNASIPHQNTAPFLVTKNSEVEIWGTSTYGPYRYHFKDLHVSDIYVIGHSGLAVDRIYPQ